MVPSHRASAGWHIVYDCGKLLPVMADRRLVILKFSGKVPTLAGCTACSLKFFTPNTFARDQVGAEHYLSQKFDWHECQERKNPRNRWTRDIQ